MIILELRLESYDNTSLSFPDVVIIHRDINCHQVCDLRSLEVSCLILVTIYLRILYDC